ncbi:MAG: RNA polymerase subunit sigma-24, partial [Rhizobiales bacterium]|nr:RNA polymerase subunit sigma-24 [Hyphomicrobiales bacterium]
SPVIELGRAVAHSMAFGPEAGLDRLDAPELAERLADFAPFAAARGDFLSRIGRTGEARAAFERAAELSRNSAERAFLLARAAACAG